MEARVQRLKAEQMEREYQKITSNVDCQVRRFRVLKWNIRIICGHLNVQVVHSVRIDLLE